MGVRRDLTRRGARTRAAAVGALLVAAAATGCSTSPAASPETPDQPAGHSHGAGDAVVSLPVGDGTTASEVGYTLADVALPERAGVAGEVRFRIDGWAGDPQTEFIPEQTKDLHLYLARDDLTVFRHLHPTMSEDGTWTAPVTVPGPGDYRVIAEFVAADEGGNGDHVVLGAARPVGGTGLPQADPDSDPYLEVEVVESPAVGADGRLRLAVRDVQQRPVELGTYLGTSGHVTGFHERSGAVVHLHPMAEPELTEQGAELVFHSEIEQAGDYRLFVQVRVDGFLHTVPVDLTVG